jgi:hypothetical protein
MLRMSFYDKLIFCVVYAKKINFGAKIGFLKRHFLSFYMTHKKYWFFVKL